MNILKKTNTTNTSYLPNRKIEYLVIHYTAGVRSAPGTARNLAAWFGNPSAQASADFIVDDAEFVQYNPDLYNRYCWAVGGNKYTSLSTSQGASHYYKANNKNCISIEMCSSKKNTSTLSATDTDWYFTDKVIKNAIELAKYLMVKFNISADHVIMHHNVTGKICPNPFCVNERALQNWKMFKLKLVSCPTNATIIQDCRIFESMNTWSNAVENLNKGKRVYIKTDCNNGWSKVEYNHETGYIKNKKVSMDDTSGLSVYPERKIVEDCNLWSERDKNTAEKLCSLLKGEKITLLAKDEITCYVEYRGIKGYVAKKKTNVK